MGDIIKNLKEFIWDIIGFLIPGFILILLLNFVLLSSIEVENDFLFDWNLFGDYAIVVIAYALGYVVYAVTIFKVRNQDSLILTLTESLSSWPKLTAFLLKSSSVYWETNFQKSATFKNSIQFLKDNGYTNTGTMKVNEVRNILMSRDPSMDQKVYTFMFRSSLFDHISTILFLVILLVILQFAFSFCDIYFLKTTPQYNTMYVVFLVLIPLLGRCKRIFFPIAKRIPFSNLKKD